MDSSSVKITGPFIQVTKRIYAGLMICPCNWNPLSRTCTYRQAVTVFIEFSLDPLSNGHSRRYYCCYYIYFFLDNTKKFILAAKAKEHSHFSTFLNGNCNESAVFFITICVRNIHFRTKFAQIKSLSRFFMAEIDT